jgi:hypothetical protein
MANAWGELSWNAGNWGDQNNVTEQVTGLSTSIALNSVDSYPNEGWGSDFWGSENWGESAFTVPVTGLQQNIDITNPDVGWGELEWSAYNSRWGGESTVNIAIGQQVDVSGQQQNLSVGDTEIIIATEVFLNQNPLPNLTVSEGTVDASPDAIATGQQQNLSTGTLDAYNRQGWGRYFFGEEEWGASGLWETVSVTGQQLNIGTNASTDVDVSVTVELDTVDDPGWGGGQVAWGNQEWGQAEVSMAMTIGEGTVDPSPDATVVGIGLTAGVALGSVVQGDANVVINNDILPTFAARGDAQLSTAQAKFGPSSLLLDGTGDFVQSTASPVVQNDFTIEFFAYASNFAQDAYLWDNSLSSQGFAISITSAGQLRLIQNNTILQQTSSPSLNNNQWNHFALVQNGSLLNLYINGTSKLQYATGGDSYPGQSYKIGTNEGETQFFNGYIDEFRSSDIARYTTTFTPPTSAFTADGSTISLLHFDGANGSTNIVNSTGSEIPRIALGLGQGQAELDAVTFGTPAGEQLNVTLEGVVAGTSVEVDLTGNGLTLALNSINVQSWQIVDTGTNVNWNIIDTAA